MLTCRACGVVLALALAGESAAADNKQTCQAVTVMVQALNADTGAWLDRHTRNDGVEVVCSIRTVWFKRFVDLRAPGKDWAARKREEWNNIHCQRSRVAAGDRRRLDHSVDDRHRVGRARGNHCELRLSNRVAQALSLARGWHRCAMPR